MNIVSAISIGLLMTGITSVSLLQSSKDITNNISDELNKKATAIAEGGIAKYMSKLSENPQLLMFTYDPLKVLNKTPIDNWFTATSNTKDCDNKTIASTIINSNNSLGLDGEYSLIAYNYNNTNNLGEMVVDGRIKGINDSVSRVKVSFPITKFFAKDTNYLPAIMASKFNIQQSDIIANEILCTDLENCPSICNSSQADLRDSLGATKNSYISGNIKISNSIIPDIPDIPENAYPNDLGNINKNISLPRKSDIISPNNTYYYTVNNINKSSIIINNDSNIRLYVKGNIDQAGNNDIKPLKFNIPGQIHIYGDSNLEQNWTFSGNACVEAFIHAPNANIGINGGGNGCFGNKQNSPNILGVLWSKSYNVIGNPSNSSLFQEQDGLLDSLRDNQNNFPKMERVQIGNIQTFKRLSK